MTKLTPIVAEVDETTLALVDRVAGRRGISNREFAAEAVRRAAESDDDFDSFIQAGVDALERGDIVPHQQVVAELDDMIAAHRQRCG